MLKDGLGAHKGLITNWPHHSMNQCGCEVNSRVNSKIISNTNASAARAAFVHYGLTITHFYDISATPGSAAWLSNREIYCFTPSRALVSLDPEGEGGGRLTSPRRWESLCGPRNVGQLSRTWIILR
jgi:hypothetical protein